MTDELLGTHWLANAWAPSPSFLGDYNLMFGNLSFFRYNLENKIGT